MGETRVKTLLIGGAEGLLGRTAVRVFAQRGLRVIGACRTPEDLRRMGDFVRAEGLHGVTLVQADLGDESSVRALVAAAEKTAPLDGVFNAAGGFLYGSTTEAKTSDYDFLMTANLKSSFLLAQATLGGMTKRGFGRLVFVSSRSTLDGLGQANMGLYLAAKAGLNAFVTSLAAEIKKTGVTANAVMPSMIDTPANRKAMPDATFADWVTPEALLEIVWTLLGPVGDPINGALIPVAGRM